MLTGILVSVEDGDAADGRDRLLPAERQGDAAREPTASAVRGQRAGPRAAGAEPDRRRRPSAETVSIVAQDNQIVFGVDRVTLSSRLIDGQFPNYRQLLPETYEHEVRWSRDELLAVVRRVSLMAQRNAPAAAAVRGRAGDAVGSDAGRRRGVGDGAGQLPGRASSRSGSTRSSCRTASRASSRTSCVLQADQPAAAGPDRGGRAAMARRTVPLPDHAGAPQRLSAAAPRATSRSRRALRDFRNYERAEVDARRRRHGARRPGRRRQDEPARGALLRLHRPLLPDLERSGADPVRRAPSRVSRRRATTAARSTRARGRRSQPRAPKVDEASTGCASTAPADVGEPPARVRVHARSPRAGEGRRPASAAPTSTTVVGGALAGAPRDRARRLRARPRAAQRAARPRARRAARRATRCTAGTASWRATASS